MNKLLCTLLITSAASAPPAALSQSSQPCSSQSSHKLEGIWIFRSLIDGHTPVYVGTARFLQDGTFAGPGPDQHTGSVIGSWIRTGAREFAFTFVADSYDASGNFLFTSRIRGMMMLSDDGLSASGTTILERFDTAGNVIFSSPAPTAFTGTRITVEPF